MGAVDLQNAYEADSKAVKSLLRSTIRSAMDPTNTNYNITTIKLDFSNGRLLVGDDPRYIYRSPVMTVETIPIDPTYNSERDVSIASEIIEGGARKYAGGESIAAAAAIECGRSLETNSSMLNAMADGEESTVTAYDYYRAYLNVNDLSEAEYPFIPNENDASHISKEDIVKWIEDGEKAITTSVPQKAAWEVTSMNSFSTLESVSSTTTFEKSNYGIREIANKFDNDNTLEDVTSLASTNESSENDDFSETPIIRTSYPN